MTLVDDRSQLDETLLPNGQQRSYLVLSEAERAKGFVRPVRLSYRHVGIAGPQHPLRDLTDHEREFFAGEGYVKAEEWRTDDPDDCDGTRCRFWTQAELDNIGKGCGAVTTMGVALAETYARQPGFYSGTFCCGCGVHLPVGEEGEFVWEPYGSRVGT